jgi:hypothetical protein
MHDGNSDGDYDDTGEKTLLTGLATSLWRSTAERQDAEFYNGWMYFTTGDQWVTTHFITRITGTPSISGNIVADRNVWPTTPPAAYGPQYLTLGDPDNDGLTDIYAHMGSTQNGAYHYALGHWEDDGDGALTAAEFIDSIALGNNARDVQLVTSGGHSMIVYLDNNMVVKYVNLMDNGSFDAEMGTLFTTGLTPSDNNYVYLKMDQVGGGSTEIPEPATLLLVGTGALGILGYIRRRSL